MTAAHTRETLDGIGILPVVVIDDAGHAEPLARALMAGGVPCAEFTLRTPAGRESLARAARVPGFLAGAGTVLDPDDVDRVIADGSAFIVSPGLDEGVIARAAQRATLIIPGVATATELMRARHLGLDLVKLFPAEVLGGPTLIDALHGPFPEMAFVPSGGITLENAGTYRRAYVSPISTSWITPRQALRAGRFDEITRRAEQFRKALDDD